MLGNLRKGDVQRNQLPAYKKQIIHDLRAESVLPEAPVRGILVERPKQVACGQLCSDFTSPAPSELYVCLPERFQQVLFLESMNVVEPGGRFSECEGQWT